MALSGIAIRPYYAWNICLLYCVLKAFWQEMPQNHIKYRNVHIVTMIHMTTKSGYTHNNNTLQYMYTGCPKKKRNGRLSVLCNYNFLHVWDSSDNTDHRFFWKEIPRSLDIPRYLHNITLDERSLLLLKRNFLIILLYKTND